MYAMQFSINLSGLGARHYPAVSAVAEQHGFTAIWMPEHLIFPVDMPPMYSYTEDGYPPMNSRVPTFDPWVVLGAVASMTSTIKLGTGVYILPLRHPIKAARSVVTLDRMSNGRVLFGIGVGWMSDEFDIVGEDFSNRGRRTDEMIELMRKLWSDEVIEHRGEFYDIPPVYFEPKPVKGADGIPIIVGGTSPAALKRAGTIGDGWTHHRQIRQGDRNEYLDRDFDELEQHITTIRRHREEAERTGPFEIVAGMGNEPSSISRAADLGVTMYTIGPQVAGLRGTKDQFAEWIETTGADTITAWSGDGAVS